MAAFDLRWSVDCGILPFVEQPKDLPPPDVRVSWAGQEHCKLDDPSIIWTGSVGDPITLERGEAGDHLFVYGDRALFHLSPSLDEVSCHTGDRADHAWRRVLLDTVMFCTALLRGRRMLHAAAVAIGGRVVAIAGISGAGKSSLAWELVRSGAALVSDDVVTLTIDEQVVSCAPGPPLMNLPPAGRLDAIATEIASFPPAGERWVHVLGASREPGPLAAIVLLDRRHGQRNSMERVAPTPLALLPLSIHLDLTAAGAADRFNLLSDVADRVAIYSLRADVHQSPTALGRRMISCLRRDGLLGVESPAVAVAQTGSELRDRPAPAAAADAAGE